MSAVLKRIIFVLAIVTALLFFSLIGAAWYLGAFDTVILSNMKTPLQYFVIMPEPGNYEQALSDLQNLQDYVEQKSYSVKDPAIFLYNDPMLTPLPQVVTRAAYLLTDSCHIEPPYQLLTVSPRNVVIASIEANPAVAPYKTYPAIREWCQRYHLDADTTGIIIEYYQSDGQVVVEFPLF